MPPCLSRRSILIGGLSLPLWLSREADAASNQAGRKANAATARRELAALEAKHGGRLGVSAVDTGTGKALAYRAHERFALCSTHKFMTVAAVLAQVDKKTVKLDQRVRYTASDILSYAPVTKKHVADGFMTVDALCAASIEWSDNTAANLLLDLVGGPSGWTHFARSIGDKVSRLDRTEPSLNEARPGDARDTTTPEAMLHDLRACLFGPALGEASRKRLEGWLLATTITTSLLRAGMPKDWKVGDKSGAGEHATRNDIGIVLRPNAAPILATAYYTQSPQPMAERDSVIAAVGEIIARHLA